MTSRISDILRSTRQIISETKTACTFFLRRVFIYPIDTLLISSREKKHQANMLFHEHQKTPNTTLCVFIHYDANNKIDSHCEHYLNALKKAGCDIIFVSTSKTLTSDALLIAKQYCFAAMIRTNIGRDIYSYKIGIAFAEPFLPNYEKLILANDSVYGPLFDLHPLIHFGDDKKLDFWGATDSGQLICHIQSYFFVFTRSMFMSTIFKNYWHNIKLINHKRHLIEKYELKIAHFFNNQGFSSGVYCHYSDVANQMPDKTPGQLIRKLKAERYNISHFAWDYLISNHHFPFIKKELVLRNPAKIKLTNFQEVINARADFPITLSPQNNSKNPLIKIHQIFFNPSQTRYLDPAFIPFDNCENPQLELCDYAVFRKAFFENMISKNALTGFLSWKFNEKTHLTGQDFMAFIRANPGYDVYFVNPFPHESLRFNNVWAQGAAHHPKLLTIVQKIFAQIGLPVDINQPMSVDQILYCNYWVGNDIFWKKYIAFCEPIYDYIFSTMDRTEFNLLMQKADNLIDAGYIPFIFERLFSTLLQLDSSIKSRSFFYSYKILNERYGLKLSSKIYSRIRPGIAELK